MVIQWPSHIHLYVCVFNIVAFYIMIRWQHSSPPTSYKCQITLHFCTHWWFTLLGHCSPLSAGKPPSPSWNVVYLHLPCAAMVPSQSLTMHANAAQESCIRHSDQPRGYETWWFYVHCQMRRIAMQTCCAVRCLYDFMSFAKHINHKSMLGTQGNVMKIIRYCKGRNVLTLGAFGSSQFMQQW